MEAIKKPYRIMTLYDFEPMPWDLWQREKSRRRLHWMYQAQKGEV